MAEDIKEGSLASRPIKLALVSCGLGRVQRGFEITTSRWQTALSSDPRLELKVFGGGEFPNGERVWNIARNDTLDSPLSIFRGFNERRFWDLCYRLEQMTFSIGFIPKLLSWQPDFVWTKEVPLGRLLMVIRKLFRLKFKIIFADGDALEPLCYEHFDQIQHLYPDSFEKAVQSGIAEEKMHILPNCVFYATPGESREELRQRFGLHKEDYIIVGVAAWNSYQKRLDYLIREAAALCDPSVKLLLCGHPEAETKALKLLAVKELGKNVRWFTLAPEDVHRALYISDVFVLPSFREGLPNALIEAVMAELPVVCHPHSGGKYILKEDQWLVDMSTKGALANRLKFLRSRPRPEEEIKRLQDRAIERFSADTLAEEFYEMVERVYTTDAKNF